MRRPRWVCQSSHRPYRVRPERFEAAGPGRLTKNADAKIRPSLCGLSGPRRGSALPWSGSGPGIFPGGSGRRLVRCQNGCMAAGGVAP